MEDALLSIVSCIRNTPAYFAQRLLDAMKGLGSDKKQLTRILVARAEVSANIFADNAILKWFLNNLFNSKGWLGKNKTGVQS